MRYSTSEQLQSICPNSLIQEVYLPCYEVELNFNNNIKEQKEFFKRREKQLLPGEVVTFMFNNKWLPILNMASVSLEKSQVKYELYLVFEHATWQEKVPLHHFINKLLLRANKQNIDLTVEGCDDYGYYLILKSTHMPDTTIKRRLKLISQELIALLQQSKQ